MEDWEFRGCRKYLFCRLRTGNYVNELIRTETSVQMNAMGKRNHTHNQSDKNKAG